MFPSPDNFQDVYRWNVLEYFRMFFYAETHVAKNLQSQHWIDSKLQSNNVKGQRIHYKNWTVQYVFCFSLMFIFFPVSDD